MSFNQNIKYVSNMKKILLLTLCLTAISCNNNTAKEPSKEFNGNVKGLKEFTYRASEKFGEPTVGELLLSHISEYESDGKIIKVEKIIKVGYDDEGFKNVSKYEYTDKGQKAKRSSFDTDGELTEVSKFEYNNKEQEIKTSSFDIDGELKSVVKTEYNDKGQEVKYSHYDNEGEITWVSTFEYNDRGNVTTTSSFGEDGELESVLEYKYIKFDGEDNWLERESYVKNKISSIDKREFIYW